MERAWSWGPPQPLLGERHNMRAQGSLCISQRHLGANRSTTAAHCTMCRPQLPQPLAWPCLSHFCESLTEPAVKGDHFTWFYDRNLRRQRLRSSVTLILCYFKTPTRTKIDSISSREVRFGRKDWAMSGVHCRSVPRHKKSINVTNTICESSPTGSHFPPDSDWKLLEIIKKKYFARPRTTPTEAFHLAQRLKVGNPRTGVHWFAYLAGATRYMERVVNGSMLYIATSAKHLVDRGSSTA